MNTFKSALQATTLAVALVGISACATDDPNRNTKIGAGVGAVLGGVLGNQVSDATGSPYVGAVVGAIAGGAVGNYMDKQRRQMEQDLAQEAAADELYITTMADGSLRVGLASDVSFDFNSDQLRPDALDTYAKIANVLKTYDKTVIHVVGHTDTSGANTYNQTLSERRASSVTNYLASQGVPGARVRQEGRGERELVVRTADNVKEARNRRVDIVIKPVVENNEQQAWTPPPYLGA